MRLLYKIKKIFKLENLSQEEITALSIPRSGKWRKVRAEHLEINPCCAICGSTHKVVPHHIIPVHVDPSKELDPDNLISLCQGKTFNCHLFFGHLKNWSCWNPNVVEDVKVWNHRFENK